MSFITDSSFSSEASSRSSSFSRIEFLRFLKRSSLSLSAVLSFNTGAAPSGLSQKSGLEICASISSNLNSIEAGSKTLLDLI
jgi:hypothetical protein